MNEFEICCKFLEKYETLHERILGVFDEKWKQINYRRKSDHVQVKMNLQLSDGYVKHANLKDALYKCNQIH